MLKEILNLNGVKKLESSNLKEINGGGGASSGSASLSINDRDYWEPGEKFACYVTAFASGNHPSFSHLSFTDETGSTYVCYPY